MKKISDLNFFKKKILLRADLNVPMENGEIKDIERIDASLRTIKEIIRQKPNLFLIVSHLGRPEGKINKEFSLRPVAEDLEKKVNFKIQLIESLEQLEEIKKEKIGGIYILENIRFWLEEEAGDNFFAKKIASGFDIYINDAFSCSHREHASIVGFSKYTKEKCAGWLFAEEWEKLSEARDNPRKPSIAIIGGAKIETKLPVIENLKNHYDYILVGGLIANEGLDRNLDLGENVLWPIDFSPKEKRDQRLDIGYKTIKDFKEKINSAKTIVWNGPMGKFEEAESAVGTQEIMQSIINNKEANKVIGGGETLEAVKKFGDFSQFDYVSMSGGAMLEFLAGKELPGIKALKD